jgi:hypothetical protein
MPKRGRSKSRARANYARVPNLALLGRARAARAGFKKKKLNQQVSRLIKTIETKEGQWKTSVNVSLWHNDVNIITAPGSGGAYLNAFQLNQGTADQDMSNGNGQRIGDEITVQSVTFRAFMENSLQRGKVYYRWMLVKCAKGDLPTRTTLFKNNAGNKMIDEINTERFSIVASRIFNVTASNTQASTPAVNGAPVATGTEGGQATKMFSIRIPGRKFGRNGVVKYENGSQGQVKFYDYVPLIVVYDWYGTPQDINAVGRINEMYAKIRFKDA